MDSLKPPQTAPTTPTSAFGEDGFFVRSGAVPTSKLRDQDRIDEIVSPLKTEINVTFRSSICARLFRRNYNICIVKMFVYAHERGYTSSVEEALDAMESEVKQLEDEIKAMGLRYLPVDRLQPQNYTAAVTNQQSARLLRLLKEADRLITQLYAADLLGHIERTKRWELTQPFNVAFALFKRVAIVQKGKAKTLDELLNEVRVEST
jgi:hypothetical protein